MDEWSDSDVEEVRDSLSNKNCGKASQDLFSEKISQLSFSDSEFPCTEERSLLDADNDEFARQLEDDDELFSGANTDWLSCRDDSMNKSQKAAKRAKRLSGKLSAGSTKRTSQGKSPKASQAWSEGFPENMDDVDDSLHTLSPDKTQQPRRLPNFSFLKNSSIDSVTVSQPPCEDQKIKPHSTTKRLGSRFYYPKNNSLVSTTSSDSHLDVDPEVMRPPQPPSGSKPKVRASASPSQPTECETESPMDLNMDLLKADTNMSCNDETMMTAASINSATSDVTVYQPDSHTKHNDTREIQSISFKDKYKFSRDLREEIVPASYTSLELSPSFQALAAELDDPEARPSETQLKQIEQELEQLPVKSDDALSQWSSFPNDPTQKEAPDHSTNSCSDPDGIADYKGRKSATRTSQSLDVVYGTVDESYAADDDSVCTPTLSRPTFKCGSRSSKKRSMKSCDVQSSRRSPRKASYVVPDLSDNEQSPALTKSKGVCCEVRSTSRSGRITPQAARANKEIQKKNSTKSPCTGRVGAAKISPVLKKSVTPSRNISATLASRGQGNRRGTKIADVSIDLTASDEDEVAGVVTRRSGIVSPSKSIASPALVDDRDDQSVSCEDVPSGSEECVSEHPSSPPIGQVRRRRRIVVASQSDSQLSASQLSSSSTRKDNGVCDDPSLCTDDMLTQNSESELESLDSMLDKVKPSTCRVVDPSATTKKATVKSDYKFKSSANNQYETAVKSGENSKFGSTSTLRRNTPSPTLSEKESEDVEMVTELKSQRHTSASSGSSSISKSKLRRSFVKLTSLDSQLDEAKLSSTHHKQISQDNYLEGSAEIAMNRRSSRRKSIGKAPNGWDSVVTATGSVTKQRTQSAGSPGNSKAVTPGGSQSPHCKNTQLEDKVGSTGTSILDNPRRSKRLTSKHEEPNISAHNSSFVKETSTSTQDKSCSDDVANSSTMDASINSTGSGKAKKTKRKHNLYSHERLVIDDVALPVSQMNPAENVRSLLEFLEDTASALQPTKQPIVDLITPELDKLDDSIPVNNSEPSKTNTPDQTNLEKAKDVQDNIGRNEFPKKQVESENSAIENEVLATENKTMLDRPSFVEMMSKSKPKQRRQSKRNSVVDQEEISNKKVTPRGDSTVPSPATTVQQHDTVKQSKSGESCSVARINQGTMNEGKAVSPSKRKRKSDESEMRISTQSKNQRRSLRSYPSSSTDPESPQPSGKQKKRHRSVRSMGKTAESTQDENIKEVSQDNSSLDDSFELPKNRMYMRKEPIWLARYSVSRNRKSANPDTQSEEVDRAPTRAEAVFNLFNRSYSGKRYRDHSFNESGTKATGTSSAKAMDSTDSTEKSVSSELVTEPQKTIDSSVYDFIPSQPSPAKNKKKRNSKLPASKSNTGKVQKPRKPRKNTKVALIQKQELIKQMNEDWGINETSLKSGLNGVGETEAEPPMSQATSLIHHINDIDSNVTLTVANDTPKKRCRFRSVGKDKQGDSTAKGSDLVDSLENISNKSVKASGGARLSNHKTTDGSGKSVSGISAKDSKLRDQPTREKISVDNAKQNTASGATNSTLLQSPSQGTSTEQVELIPVKEIKTELGPDENSSSCIRVVNKKVKSDIRTFMGKEKDPSTPEQVKSQIDVPTTPSPSPMVRSRRRTGKTIIEESDTQTDSSTLDTTNLQTTLSPILQTRRGRRTQPVISSGSEVSMCSDNLPEKSKKVKPGQVDQKENASQRSKKQETGKSRRNDKASPVVKHPTGSVIEKKSGSVIEEKPSPADEEKPGPVAMGKPGPVVKGKSGSVVKGKSGSVVKGKPDPVVKGKSDPVVKGKSGPVVKEFGRPTRNTQIGTKLVFTCTSLTKEQRQTVENCAKILDAKVVQSYTSEEILNIFLKFHILNKHIIMGNIFFNHFTNFPTNEEVQLTQLERFYDHPYLHPTGWIILERLTHVFTSINGDSCCPRTLKYMLAVLEAKWIVNAEWATFCLEESKHLPEEIFEVVGSTVAPKSSASIIAREHRSKGIPPLFSGCQFYLSGDFNPPSPPKDDLLQLIQAGGAKILNRMPREASTIPAHHADENATLSISGTIIITTNHKLVPKVANVSYVNPSWLLDSIAHYILMPTDKYE